MNAFSSEVFGCSRSFRLHPVDEKSRAIAKESRPKFPIFDLITPVDLLIPVKSVFPSILTNLSVTLADRLVKFIGRRKGCGVRALDCLIKQSKARTRG